MQQYKGLLLIFDQTNLVIATFADFVHIVIVFSLKLDFKND